MAVQPIQQAPTQDEKKRVAPGNGMTRDDFLKLLITQLQNQDPLKPLDNQEFAAQLAAFNSLDQLIGINEKLDTMQAKQLLLNQVGTASLMGKEIVASGNKVSYRTGAETRIGYTLNADAARVVVNITDSKGEMVRSLEAGSRRAGEQTTVWDGRDSTGRVLADGVYSFEVNAFDGSGKKISVITKVQGVVTGVSLVGSEPLLEIGEIKIPLSAVISIR